MIPRWFLYLQGIAMMVVGGAYLILRPERATEDHEGGGGMRGKFWAIVACAIGVGLLVMAWGNYGAPSQIARPSVAPVVPTR